MSTTSSGTVFESVVVGVDGSSEGFVALEQAQRLLEPRGELEAIVVCCERLAVHAGFEAPRLAHELHAEAQATLARAEEMLRTTPGAIAALAHGDAAEQLLEAASVRRATLLAVGSHSHSRAAGVLLGSVASRLLHEAPAPVLVARASDRPEVFPVGIVVGADGSRASELAVATGRGLARRFGSTLRVLVAEGGKELDTVGLVGLGPFERNRRAPVEALVDAAREADIVVVGSRGLHGLAALGSVSERVAHRAICSVLVVRPAVTTGEPRRDQEAVSSCAARAIPARELSGG